MKGLLFLNGEPPSEKILKSIDFSGCFTVCADGAYNYLKGYCVPDVLLGDFDSLADNYPALTVCEGDISAAELVRAGIRAKKAVKFNAEKDFTDGHLALLMFCDAAKGAVAASVDIYGALGKRADHQLGNLSLLALAASKGIKGVIKGEYTDVFLASAEFIAPAKPGKTVSLVPFTDTVHILSTRGLKYSVCNEVFGKLHMKGISNVATESEISYVIKSGLALVFIDR